ncbi:hypothetical protein FKM82_025642 [Ascaphus truei]
MKCEISCKEKCKRMTVRRALLPPLPHLPSSSTELALCRWEKVLDTAADVYLVSSALSFCNSFQGRKDARVGLGSNLVMA